MTHNITDIKKLLAESLDDSPRPWKADMGPAELAYINTKDGSPVGESVLDSDAQAIVATMNAADDMVELVETMLQWKQLLGVYEGKPEDTVKVLDEINELTGRMHAILERFSL